jgi:hypothetical protein
VTSSSPSSSTAAAYPLPRPACDDDPRFTSGLVFDIADVLTNHGHPHPADTDWADLMLALFRFLYQPPPAQKGDQ